MQIDLRDIKRLIDYYWQHQAGITHSGSMNKIGVREHWDRGLGEILEPYLGTTPVGDNFYRHNRPYLPHADNRPNQETDNIVIPLQTTTAQTFVVFDQHITTTGRTWVGDLDFDHSILEPNTAIRTRPYDSGIVQGLTEQPCPDELYQHLPWHDRDYYHGLTGTVYDWIPGETIRFNSRQIHATGRQPLEYKLGLTIRVPREP